jgi:hypothetical protein
MREFLKDVVPNIVDTFMYCLLAELEHSRVVRVSVALGDSSIQDVARLSWGLPAEASGEDGWLSKFSKQRFEQPY